MTTGTVKWFNPHKHYGFIVPDQAGQDVFVHLVAIEESGLTGLAKDQRVRIDVEQGPKGPYAARVERL